MGESRGYYAKLNKADREKIQYDLTYIENLKNQNK